VDDTVIGCIGLGVMGEPICANLVRRSGARVRGFDLRAEPLSRLAEQGSRARRRPRTPRGMPR
jgi:hypothetical protein